MFSKLCKFLLYIRKQFLCPYVTNMLICTCYILFGANLCLSANWHFFLWPTGFYELISLLLFIYHLGHVSHVLWLYVIGVRLQSFYWWEELFDHGYCKIQYDLKLKGIIYLNLWVLLNLKNCLNLPSFESLTYIWIL